MSWRRHGLNVKTKASNAEKNFICFQAAIWKMKVEALLVCNVCEHHLKKRYFYDLWIIVSQLKFVSVCILKVRFHEHLF